MEYAASMTIISAGVFRQSSSRKASFKEIVVVTYDPKASVSVAPDSRRFAMRADEVSEGRIEKILRSAYCTPIFSYHR
jgi:hypothetical protein